MIVKMKYGVLQEMAQAFSQARETTETMSNEINSIAQQLGEGALIGESGDAFEQACRGALIPTLQRLGVKFDKLNAELTASIESMQNTDSNTGKLYN